MECSLSRQSRGSGFRGVGRVNLIINAHLNAIAMVNVQSLLLLIYTQYALCLVRIEPRRREVLYDFLLASDLPDAVCHELLQLV